MQDAADKDVSILYSVNYDVLLMIHLSVTSPNLVARSAYPGRSSNLSKAIIESIKITVCLIEAPNIHGVVGDLDQVKASQLGEPIFRQLFAP